MLQISLVYHYPCPIYSLLLSLCELCSVVSSYIRVDGICWQLHPYIFFVPTCMLGKGMCVVLLAFCHLYSGCGNKE